MSSGIVGGVSLWLVRKQFCWLCHTVGAWSVEVGNTFGQEISFVRWSFPQVTIFKHRSIVNVIAHNIIEVTLIVEAGG